MAIKKIHLKSVLPIAVDALESLDRVNQLRKERGENKKGKTALTLEQWVATTKVLVDRSAEFGCIDLSIRYSGNIRWFPNFGLDIESGSSITYDGTGLLLVVDVTVAGGRKKWQVSEIQECAEALAAKDTAIDLRFVSDMKSDSAGYSTDLALLSGEKNEKGKLFLPMSFFSVSAL